MQKKWLSILLFAPLMQSNYALADQAVKKELDYKALGEVLFFDKSKLSKDVILVDASKMGEDYQEGNNKKKRLREEEIEKIKI